MLSNIQQICIARTDYKTILHIFYIVQNNVYFLRQQATQTESNSNIYIILSMVSVTSVY